MLNILDRDTRFFFVNVAADTSEANFNDNYEFR